MNYDDDEDWQSEDDELVTCPECKADVYLDLNDDRCPKCGYWFLVSDRDKMWKQTDSGKSLVIKIVALVVLLAIVLPLLLVLLQ